MKRTAQAIWNGSGLEGSGKLNTPSGVFQDHPYSVKTRFENADGKAGTNPEELIAAAHAGCFNMALSFQLAGAGFPADELNTTAVVNMAQEGQDWYIPSIDLELTATVPGIDEQKFLELANIAKENCPISKALASVEINLKAKLV